MIAPKQVSLYTWQKEAEKFDNLKSLCSIMNLIEGTENKRIEKLNNGSDYCIDIISSSLVEWLVKGNKERKGKRFVWTMKHKLKHYDMVIVDECSQFKDTKTNRYKSLEKLSNNTEYLFLLSGTPFSNIQYDKNQSHIFTQKNFCMF